MIELIVNNSYSQAKNLTTEQYAAFRKLLSYEPDEAAAFFGGFKGSGRRYLIDRKGFFPTGLLARTLELILEKAYSFKLTDMRVQPTPQPKLFTLDLKATGITPYPEQLAAAKAVKKAHRGVISAVTGVGKSAIAALIVNELQVPTLIVTPSLELKAQLSGTMRQWFGAAKVGKGRPIYVENYQALDPDKVLEGYQALLIDEFHHSGARSYQKLNKGAWKDIYYRIGLTATDFRSKDEEEILLRSILAERIYEISYKTAVAKSYIVPIEGYYVDVPKQAVEGNTWAQVYSELVVNNAVRNQIIADLLMTLEAGGSSTLCLVKEIKHGRILSEMTGIPFMNGEDEESRGHLAEFNSGKLTALIATTGVCSEGVDTKKCEFVIVAGLGKAKNAFMQLCGRAVRKSEGKDSAKVVLFRDPSNKWTLKHYREQCKILLTEYGSKVENLEV